MHLEQTIRILQCIYNIRHPLLLDRLRLGLDKLLDPKLEQGSNINMLLYLYTYLDKQANKSYILVLQS